MPGEKFQYVQMLAERVATEPALEEEVRQDPASALKRLAAPAQIPDTRVYRIVVTSLGLAVLITIVAATILAGLSKEIPDGIIAIGSAACGALAGLLAPSPVQGGTGQ